MQANTRKRFSRSGCPSTHFLFRRDLADYCEPPISYRLVRADMFSRSTGHGFARDCHCGGPGQRRPGWDI